MTWSADKEAHLRQVCRAKVRHGSEAKALRAASRLAGKHNTRSLRVYSCRHCNGWHLTSIPRAMDNRPACIRNKGDGSSCMLYVDGLPALAVGHYLRTDGGSVYEVIGIRPSPGIKGRRYLRCIRTAPADVPSEARVWTLHWYRRKNKGNTLKASTSPPRSQEAR